MSLYSGPAAPARAFATLPDDRFTLLGDVTGYEVRGHTLILDCGGPRLAVSFLAADLARVRLAPSGDFRPLGHGADATDDPFSYALDPERTWTPDGISVTDDGTEILVRTPAMTLRVRMQPCRLTFETRAGEVFLQDTAGAGWVDLDDRTETRCWKACHPTSRFFGLGDKTFELDRKGRALTFWNSDTYAYAPEQDPIYKSIPFLLGLTPSASSSDAWTGYGLFLDNTYRSNMDLGASSEDDWWFGSTDGELRYFVFAPGSNGTDLKTPLGRYCDLTGHKPLPPRWALGYHQSRWNYHDEGYVRWIAHEHRRRNLPLDCIHLDIGHMDGYRVFTWNPDTFPDAVALNRDLNEMGVRSVVIVDPGVKVDPDYFAYQEGKTRRLFCENPDGTDFTDTVWPGDVHWPDFSKPEARMWWGHLHQRYLASGVTGFWNDMNEPAILGGRDFPDYVQFDYGDRGGKATDHLEAHNVYGLLMGRATYEGLRDVRPDERPFLLTRACFSGSQRYAAAWTGDNVSSWEHMLLSFQMCQSLSASGLAFCGPDIGGFAAQPSPELYARWMQMGVLYPFMRTHYSHEEIEAQEPWAFGEEAEDACRKALQLRYRLLPTIYSAFEACSRTGLPPMKALVLEHPDDPRTHTDCDDQTYLGDTLMAAPVMHEGARQRDVYFPSVDGGWYDFTSGRAIAGGQSHTVDAPFDHLPLFARAGGVVALDPPALHTGVTPEVLELRIFPGTGTSAFYFDDGLSYAYESGDAFRLQLDVRQLDVRQLDDALTIDVGRDGSFGLPHRTIEWTIPMHASSVLVDGTEIAIGDTEPDVEGAWTDGAWLHIRTRTDVTRLEGR
ncbi:MAG: glycoside hydrolase family 31 protein [Bacteroidota bacterium]